MIKTRSKFAKSLALLLFISAISMGLSQGIQQAAPGQPVVGEITLGHGHGNKNLVEISAPESISGGTLIPGIVNELEGTLHVQARGGWQLEVSADKFTNGYMTEYVPDSSLSDTDAYMKDGNKLKNSMKVKASSYGEVDLKNEGVLISQKDTSQKNEVKNFDIPITFEQLATWDDTPLPEGHVYRIIVTFTAFSTS
ncbi:Uncharacterised protein [uncultured archaeon]|nr:Uncharacterised protein [uncultured archaeon]